MKLPKPGPAPFNRAVFKNARDTYFGGAAVIVGKGKSKNPNSQFDQNGELR